MKQLLLNSIPTITLLGEKGSNTFYRCEREMQGFEYFLQEVSLEMDLQVESTQMFFVSPLL